MNQWTSKLFSVCLVGLCLTGTIAYADSLDALLPLPPGEALGPEGTNPYDAPLGYSKRKVQAVNEAERRKNSPPWWKFWIPKPETVSPKQVKQTVEQQTHVGPRTFKPVKDPLLRVAEPLEGEAARIPPGIYRVSRQDAGFDRLELTLWSRGKSWLRLLVKPLPQALMPNDPVEQLPPEETPEHEEPINQGPYRKAWLVPGTERGSLHLYYQEGDLIWWSTPLRTHYK